MKQKQSRCLFYFITGVQFVETLFYEGTVNDGDGRYKHTNFKTLSTKHSTIVGYPGQGGPHRVRVELEITNTRVSSYFR